MHKVFINILRVITMAIFIAIIPVLFLYDFGTTLVWTILIPLLPIALLIIGFSRWRDICPLAMVSKISQSMNFIDKRKVPDWFEDNFWLFGYSMLFLGLSLRLIVLNNDSNLLGMFFIFVVLAAFFTNLFFTGKSWCNFFCPVGTVEKIYTVSNAKNYMVNSACTTCTACKKNCPDIDLESNYWKEGSFKQKTFVFYSFSGMVLGFYLYFYLYSGSFSYYFLGNWTAQNFPLFSQGFFFAKEIPLIIAVPLTLIFFMSVSYYFFYFFEQYTWRNKTFKTDNFDTHSHIMKTISSFVSFNLFYIFAGAPAYLHYPISYAVFYFIVVSVSSIILYKEIFRQEAYFVQERFALKAIKRWNSTKALPSNLKEIYYTYVNENKSKADKLKTYKNSITDLMQEGILTEGSMQLLERLREQIGISARDHSNVMRLIKLKNENLFDSSIEKSSEKRYQEYSYKTVIENAISEHLELDKDYLLSLQKQFNISDDIHTSIMESIVNDNEKIHQDILNSLEGIHNLVLLENSIFKDGTREIKFLRYSIKNEFIYASKDLFSLLFTIYSEHKKTLKTLLNLSKGKQIHPDFVMDKSTLSFMHSSIADKMLHIHADFINELAPKENINKNIITDLLAHESLQIATAALLSTKKESQIYLNQVVFDRFCNTQDIEILSLLYKLKYKTDHITTYERMMYLNAVPLFGNLKFNDLHVLGQTTKVQSFQKDHYIIKQGDIGKTLYALISGGANIEVDGITVANVGQREYFGEIALLGDTRRTASVKITQDTVALVITKKSFKRFLQNNPKVGTKVMKEIIKQLTKS